MKGFEKHIHNFLMQSWDKKRGLLLAFSGGTDSLALLHALLSFRRSHPAFSFALAHVDHGWREESGSEAIKIAEMAEKLDLPLHRTKLDPKDMKGNLEAACREARLQFFAHLCQLHDYQATLVAHHADDLAETVLKRVLEGSSLPYLSGLKNRSSFGNMEIWRPLLPFPKAVLIQWLQEKELQGFDDPTNRDTRFLRARFRENILPFLSQEFGKEVRDGLCRVGRDAHELCEYLDDKVAPYLNHMVTGPFGTWLDLSQSRPQALIELKHLLRRFCENVKLSLSKENISLAAAFIGDGSSDKQVVAGNHIAYLDRGHVFITKKDALPLLPDGPLALQEGSWQYGPWLVEVSRVERGALCRGASDWRSIWQGEACVILPEGESYYLKQPDLHAPYPRSSPLSKWWTAQKIPAFLRFAAPVVCEGEDMVHEFLSGKAPLCKKHESVGLKVLLRAR